MSARNGTVTEEMPPHMQQPTADPSPPTQAAGAVAGEPRNELGVAPLNYVSEAQLASDALTIKLQAGYIGRLEAKVRELLALLDDQSAGAKA